MVVLRVTGRHSLSCIGGDWWPSVAPGPSRAFVLRIHGGEWKRRKETEQLASLPAHVRARAQKCQPAPLAANRWWIRQLQVGTGVAKSDPLEPCQSSARTPVVEDDREIDKADAAVTVQILRTLVA